MTRGSGRTTAQMLAVPQGAYFVWPVGASIGYAQALARHLGRGDLVVVSAQDGPERLRGLNVQLVMDHAAWDHIGNAVAAAWDRALRLQTPHGVPA